MIMDKRWLTGEKHVLLQQIHFKIFMSNLEKNPTNFWFYGLLILKSNKTIEHMIVNHKRDTKAIV